MLKRNGTDTIIGFIPGADIDEGTGATKGGLAKAPPALAKLFGWKGVPALGGYTYPAGGVNETWDFSKASGFPGVIGYKSFAIPNGYTIDSVHAGNCDAIWRNRAKAMVDAGQGEVIYEPGYEGSDKNFNGSAGQVVPTSTLGAVKAVSGLVLGSANWAYAVNRQINVMRGVTGWDCWINLNYDVMMAKAMGLDPDPFRLITETFQSIGCELYPYDDFSGTWSATKDEDKVIAFAKTRLALQQQACQKYNVPMGIGEAAPMIRTDGHASGDDAVFVQFLHDYAMDLTHNVAFMFLYNGTTSDTSRFALWDQATGTYKLDTTKFPKAGPAIGQLMDPANFVNRVPLVMTYTQAQLDSAVATQKVADIAILQIVQGKLDAALATVEQADNALLSANTQLQSTQAQLANTQALLSTTKISADTAAAKVQQIKDTWHALNDLMT